MPYEEIKFPAIAPPSRKRHDGYVRKPLPQDIVVPAVYRRQRVARPRCPHWLRSSVDLSTPKLSTICHTPDVTSGDTQ